MENLLEGAEPLIYSINKPATPTYFDGDGDGCGLEAPRPTRRDGAVSVYDALTTDGGGQYNIDGKRAYYEAEREALSSDGRSALGARVSEPAGSGEPGELSAAGSRWLGVNFKSFGTLGKSAFRVLINGYLTIRS